eukprot:7006082-Pyramimonas_sp.AAC.1
MGRLRTLPLEGKQDLVFAGINLRPRRALTICTKSIKRASRGTKSPALCAVTDGARSSTRETEIMDCALESPRENPHAPRGVPLEPLGGSFRLCLALNIRDHNIEAIGRHDRSSSRASSRNYVPLRALHRPRGIFLRVS